MDSLKAYLPRLVIFRKELHRNAEISGNEHFTGQMIRDFCNSLDTRHQVVKLSKTGMAFVYDSGQPGKTLMFRAELDALPIEEEIETPYISPKKTVSHKCGHDGHMAILCGLACMMHLHPIRHGRVVLLFQPAEETGKGAQMVLSDPKFKSLQPDYIFALHNIPGRPRHSILVKENIFSMASEGVFALLKGHAAHAAYPDQGISPLPALIQLIERIPLIPEKANLFKKFVQITITYAKSGKFNFGTAPGNAELALTLRAEDDNELELLHQEVTRLVAKIAAKYYLEDHCKVFEPFGTTNNSPFVVEAIRKVADREQLPLVELKQPFRWSEDFGVFTRRFPGAMFGLGTGENHSDLHTCYYDFPDEIIETGIRMFHGIIQDLSND